MVQWQCVHLSDGRSVGLCGTVAVCSPDGRSVGLCVTVAVFT